MLFRSIDLVSWINNSTKQGFPQKNIKKGNLYYWSPENQKVAEFDAFSGRVDLDCDKDPFYRDSSLGIVFIQDFFSN